MYEISHITSIKSTDGYEMEVIHNELSGAVSLICRDDNLREQKIEISEMDAVQLAYALNQHIKGFQREV